jgi:pimeloyl-ACP methyl ester carboxylesterase
MPTAKREFIDGVYGQIHLRAARCDSARARPLLCLHMFPQSSRGLQPLIEAVSTDRTAIAPDFPGYGESDPPPQPIDAAAYADAMWRVVDELELLTFDGRIDLFGIHAGAKIAVAMATQRPADVARIVLCSAAILTDTEIAAIEKSIGHIDLDTTGTRFRSLWEMLLRNRGDTTSLESLATTFAEILRAGEGYGWGHRAVFAYNDEFPDALNALHHPLTILNPRDDLYEMTPRSAPYLRNGTLKDKPDWGPGFLQQQADDVAVEIQQLLSA